MCYMEAKQEVMVYHPNWRMVFARIMKRMKWDISSEEIMATQQRHKRMRRRQQNATTACRDREARYDAALCR